MKVSQRKQKQKIHHYWLQQDKQHQYVIFTIWEEMFMSGRLSPFRTRTLLALDVEAITKSISRVIQPGSRTTYFDVAYDRIGFRLTLFM